MPDPKSHTAIEDQREELYRQVHPDLVDDDQPSWQAFCPMPKDAGELSVSAGSLVSPKASWLRFVEKGFRSYGVLSIAVAECTAESLGSFYAPLGDDEEGGPDDAHAIVDFNGLPNATQRKKKGKALLASSWRRGWAYRA